MKKNYYEKQLIALEQAGKGTIRILFDPGKKSMIKPFRYYMM